MVSFAVSFEVSCSVFEGVLICSNVCIVYEVLENLM